MSRANSWTNSDGLVVGFGTHSQDLNTPVKISSNNGIDVYKYEIDAVNLVDTISTTNQSPQRAWIPRGSFIKSATLHVSEVFTSGGAATLDLGLFGVTVVDDADGIDVDLALTVMDALGDVVLCDGALVGGLIPVGRTADEDCTITASYETAVFTAGKATLIVEVVQPSGQAGRTVAV